MHHRVNAIQASQEEGEDGRKKTREEIYSEIIAKSKLARREKQKLHNEMEDLTEKLDREYGELQQDLIGLKRQKLSAEEKKERGDHSKCSRKTVVSNAPFKYPRDFIITWLVVERTLTEYYRIRS